MRNIWKGLIIGGLTGAGAGAILDLLNRSARLVGDATKRAADIAPEAAERVRNAAATAGKKATAMTPEVAERVRSAAATAGKKATDMAPEVAERLKGAVDRGVSRVQEAEIGGHLRDQAKELAHRVAESEQSDQARDALARATKKGKQPAQSVRESAPLHSVG